MQTSPTQRFGVFEQVSVLAVCLLSVIARMAKASNNKTSLAVEFPLDATVRLKLTQGAPLEGKVYCTDEGSQTIVLTQSVSHSTLSHQVYCVSRHAVQATEILQGPPNSKGKKNREQDDARTQQQQLQVHKKALEEQEKRAMRMAEEALMHINQKASPEGQAVFDRLLKACNEVKWLGESIVVLNQIQVDPPYGVGNCKWTNHKEGRGDASSMERVQKIVGHGAKYNQNSNKTIP